MDENKLITMFYVRGVKYVGRNLHDAFVMAKTPMEAIKIAAKDVPLNELPEVYHANLVDNVLRPVGDAIYQHEKENL